MTSLPSFFFFFFFFFFESGYKFRVPLGAIVKVDVVATRRSNTMRNFPCTVCLFVGWLLNVPATG